MIVAARAAFAALKHGAHRVLSAHAALGVAGHDHDRRRKVALERESAVRSSRSLHPGASAMARRHRKGHRKAHRTAKQKAAARRNLKKARAALRRKRRRH